MRTVFIATLLATSFATVACGDDKSEAPTDDEKTQIEQAFSTITDYCIAQVREGLGSGTGGDLGDVSEATDTLIREYDEYPDGTFELQPGNEKTMRDILRDAQSQLGQGVGPEPCEPDAAAEIDDALDE